MEAIRTGQVVCLESTIGILMKVMTKQLFFFKVKEVVRFM